MGHSDVFIFTDHMKGINAGHSPGFGISLIAETLSGPSLSAENMGGLNHENPLSPEELGQKTALRLLYEINSCGVVDSLHQSFLLILCAMSGIQLHQIQTGPLTKHAIGTIEQIEKLLGVKFIIDPLKEKDAFLVTCIGANLRNISRNST